MPDSFSEWTKILFPLLGGLGIFLFGINLMGESLKSLAQNKFKTIIEKTTNTPLKAILVGALVTMVIQSSSGTTALAVGLVSAGLMTLNQAVGVIMGANIGTTATAFLVGLNITDYALPIIGIGAILIFFTKNKKTTSLGGVLVGFGMLFLGLELMGNGISPLAETKEAITLFESISKNPILGLVIGTVFTAIIQSSSAAIAILQQLYVSGNITLLGALPILLGSNIGTTITAILAGMSGNTNAKRASVIHCLFNLIGALFFMIILKPVYYPLVNFIDVNIIKHFSGANSSMSIAVAHIIFNIICTFIMAFFIDQLVYLSTKIIKDKGDELSFDLELTEKKLIKESPILALEYAKKEITKMFDLVKISFSNMEKYAFNNIEKLFIEKDKVENDIDAYNRIIHEYLMRISQEDLNDSQTAFLSKYLDTIRDLERIGDHCLNILEYFNERYLDKQQLSNEGKTDLDGMFKMLNIMLDKAYDAFLNWDRTNLNEIFMLEDKIDDIELVNRRKHIIRLNEGICSIQHVDNYIAILSNLERIGDHINNIAENVFFEGYKVNIKDNSEN